MQLSTLILRSLAYHKRTNLAVIAGVATAVAVLAGALLVGDSVRGSLRDLALGRIGRTDVVVAATSPFRVDLAKRVSSAGGVEACSLFLLEGIVSHGSSGRAASKVSVYGVDETFWKFHQSALKREAPSGRNVLVSPALAEELALQAGDPIVIRLNKPTDIPEESLHGRKEDSVKTVRLSAAGILPAEEMGEFSLRPVQSGVRAVFIQISRLQREVSQQGKANVLLLAGAGVNARKAEELLQQQASLEDLGIKVKPVVQANQLSLETTSMVVNDALDKAGRDAAKELNLDVKPVLTYLVNFIRLGNKELPYSLVTALDLSLVGAAKGIVLNEWAARDLGAKVGDDLVMDYYVWLSEGRLSTQSASLTVSRVVPIKDAAADRDYAPEYPGITEAKTIHDWDPPFPMELGKIRKVDEEYWDKYRTTPKAFVSIADGQRMWGTRYGKLTALRLVPPAGTDLSDLRDRYAKAVRSHLRATDAGVSIVGIREDSLSASAGSTDFGEYFLYFSFFLMVSALLLLGLFFKLGVEQRYREAGLLRALGYPVALIGRMLLIEGALLAAIGSAIGALFAFGYASFILYGLRTWWLDAVGTKLLRLHVTAPTLLGGAIGGFLTALLVIALSVRALRKPSPRALLQGNTQDVLARMSRRPRWVMMICGILGIVLLASAMSGKMDAAGGFFGAGAMFLVSALAAQRIWLGKGAASPNTIWKLGFRNATYRPGRSVLSVALIASATFLIVALTAFRQEGASPDPEKRPGTGGFALIGEAAIPVIHNPGLPQGRQELGFSTDAEALFKDVRVIPLRLRPGDDSSCLNLYQPRNPRILGVPDEVLFSLPLSKEKLAPRPGEYAAYVDANSLQYVLHKKVGDEIVIEPDSGSPIHLRISATIQDSVFQSEILIREADILKAFPQQQGFRMFLIKAPQAKREAVETMMEDRLKDYGLDLQSTVERLDGYHRVENAYLSTFQTLGALGLLLGTVGLAAVLLRNVLERRKELALLRAVGYQPQQLGNLVLAENVLLLASGILIGTICAALAITPAIVERGAKLPLTQMLLMLAAVVITGLLSSVMAVRAAVKSPLLESLRAE